MSKSLDEQLDEVIKREEENGVSRHTWFYLAVVAVRALIEIVKHIESMRPYHD